MASLTTSSQRSSSSFCSSSRYSTSSSYRSDGEEGPGGPHFNTRHQTLSCGPSGGAVTSWQNASGSLGDSYSMTADLRQFEPHDIVVMAYSHHVVVHAQRVLDDGSVSNTFTRKTLFPDDMDPLSVSGTLNPDGTLWVTVGRTTLTSDPSSQGYR